MKNEIRVLGSGFRASLDKVERILGKRGWNNLFSLANPSKTLPDAQSFVHVVSKVFYEEPL